MTYELKDWLKSINRSKINLMDDDPSSEKSYSPYIINRCLSGYIDRLMFVNEMNQYHFLPKKMQYDFFINSLRINTGFSPWINKKEIEDLDYVKRYYGYNDEKAKQSLRILTQQQINFIKSKFETGGKK